MDERRCLSALFRVGLFLVLAILTASCAKKQSTPEPSHPSPTPPFLPRKVYDTARLFSGITLKSSVEAVVSEKSALHLESAPDSYQLVLDVRLQIPKPALTRAELLAATPDLESLLPELDQLIQNAAPSPDFASLYERKGKNLRANLGMLQKLLPRDTLYDCQTILDLWNTGTSRHAILIQALMNVNTDGSDGDRNLEVEKLSPFFQPQTNYRWPKATSRPNPCLHNTEQQLSDTQEKLDSDALNELERTHLKTKLAEEKATIAELKRWSFLVGTADPFIVLPSFMFSNEPGHPEIGDYAVVIAYGTLYPAIVGDKGPSFKMGEASLRLCREIDDKSNADHRPVDHPEIVYLIFPGSAEKPFASPNYQHWSERCHALWREFGGSASAPWQEWESLEKPWPTPTPSPSPSPSPSPLPSPEIGPDSHSPMLPAPNSTPVTPEPATLPLSMPLPPSLPASPAPNVSSGTNPAALPTSASTPETTNAHTTNPITIPAASR